MGLLNSVKNWLNIGGVSLELRGVDPQISTGQHQMSGTAVLTTKSDKQVLSLSCQVVNEHTYKKDEETKTDRFVLGEQRFTAGFEIKTGETREIPFAFMYSVKENLRHTGGVFGAAAQLGAAAMGESDTYHLVVIADVKGAALDPSARVLLKLV